MTKDDIIRMAREVESEVGFQWCVNFIELERFAALACAMEREQCAKICDHMAARCNDMRAAALESAAENIRARSDK